MTRDHIRYACVLFVLFLFMFLGNVLRLVPLATSIGSLNTFELVLYSSCVLVLLSSWKDLLKFPWQFIAVYSLFFMSYCIGVLRIQELEALAFAYNIRIFFFFVTSYVIGLAFFKIYGTNLRRIINFYLLIFVVNTLMAWLIYVLFPDTGNFYVFLAMYGVIYNGDPHIHRLLGTLFDPNFFGNLLVLPILMCLYRFDLTQKKRYLAIFTFLLISAFFTFSRSTLLGLSLGVAFYYLLDFITYIRKRRINRSLIISAVVLAVSVVCTVWMFPDEVLRMTERFVNMERDVSASHRYNDFVLAIELISQLDIFFFGIGFNFFAFLGLTKLSSIDSSILALMVTLGIPIFAVATLTMVQFITSSLSGCLIDKSFISKVYLNYLVVSLILCNFNPLLLYPFWFFCMLPLLCYFMLNSSRRS